MLTENTSQMESNEELYKTAKNPLYIDLKIKHQLCFFNKPIYKHVIVDRLPRILSAHKMNLYAWCLMSDQLLMVVSANNASQQQLFIDDFCLKTSEDCYQILENHESEDNHKLNEFLRRTENESFHQKIWEDNCKKLALKNHTEVRNEIYSIHHKPVVAEYVIAAKHYLYSSACNYEGIQGLIPIVKLI